MNNPIVITPAREATYWRTVDWNTGEKQLWIKLGIDKNNDPVMQNTETGELRAISSRALNQTWHQRWKSLCCDRWLRHCPTPEDGVCYHK